jgi:hypothetical protein
LSALFNSPLSSPRQEFGGLFQAYRQKKNKANKNGTTPPRPAKQPDYWNPVQDFLESGRNRVF